MTPQKAQELAQDALVWIVQHDDLAGNFLGWSGASPDDVRTRAAEPAFLASVLEFLTLDDEWVIEFCDGQRLDYGAPMLARQRLEGPGQEGWT